MLTSASRACCNSSVLISSRTHRTGRPASDTSASDPVELRNGCFFFLEGDRRALGETLNPSFITPRLRSTCCTISATSASASGASERTARSSRECVRTRRSLKAPEECESAPGESGARDGSGLSVGLCHWLMLSPGFMVRSSSGGLRGEGVLKSRPSELEGFRGLGVCEPVKEKLPS